MIELSVAEIARATGGSVHTVSPESLVTADVEVDSRKVRPGGLFVALPGEHVDGHDFAAAAVASGATAVLAGRPVAVASVVVDDPQLALGQVARAVLDRLPQLRVVGITGSSGKTSTKDVTGELLARLGSIICPPGSLNNEVGLPLTALRATRDVRFLVLEYGARGRGHITYLTTIAPPDIAVVLNVGTAHLGEFGSIEATAEAKSELVAALAPEGLAVLNADDPRVAAMRAVTTARVVTVGRSAGADVRAEEVGLDALGRVRFRLVTAAGEVEVESGIYGEHQVPNVLAAAAVALECGMTLPALAHALRGVTLRSPHRMAVTTRADGVTIIDDSYNANPDSMAAGLRALAAIAGTTAPAADGSPPRRAWAVLGYMAELGAGSLAEHVAIGRLVAELGIDQLLVVGEAAEGIVTGARAAGLDCALVPDVDAAVATLSKQIAPGDVVLIKASHSVGLDRLADALLA